MPKLDDVKDLIHRALEFFPSGPLKGKWRAFVAHSMHRKNPVNFNLTHVTLNDASRIQIATVARNFGGVSEKNYGHMCYKFVYEGF